MHTKIKVINFSSTWSFLLQDPLCFLELKELIFVEHLLTFAFQSQPRDSMDDCPSFDTA
jgi:hypothetical protein